MSADPATIPFPQALAWLRKQRGLSQSKLAAETGYNQSYVTLLEAGKRQPSRETVAALCDVLDLNEHDTGLLLVSAGYVPRLPGWSVVWQGEGEDAVTG